MGARLSLDAPEKLAVSAMAHITQFNKEQLKTIQKKLYEAAQDCDRTNSSKMKHIVTRDRFVEAVKAAEIESEDIEILEKFFTLYDKYGKGEVNAAEYVSALAPLVKGELEEKMKLSFDVYTFQREQRVSARELIQWMTWAFSAAEYCGDRVPTDEALDALCDAVLEDAGEGDDIEFACAREVIVKSRTLADFLEQKEGSLKLRKNV